MKKKILIVLLLSLTTTALLITPAFAETGDTETKEYLYYMIKEIYMSLRDAAFGGAIMGCCACCISFFLGDESKAKKALASLGYILVSLAAVYFLIYAADLGKNGFGVDLKPWDPKSLENVKHLIFG